MTTFYHVLIGLHAVFAVSIVVGYVLAATRGGVVNPVLLWGARLQLIVGLLMMTFARAAAEDDHPMFNMVTAIKLLVALGVVSLVEIARSAQAGGTPRPVLVHLAGLLALVNLSVGLWLFFS